MTAENFVEFLNVEIVGSSGLALLCQIGTRTVAVPRVQLHRDSTVTKFKDRGRLVLPRAIAKELGLVW